MAKKKNDEGIPFKKQLIIIFGSIVVVFLLGGKPIDIAYLMVLLHIFVFIVDIRNKLKE